MINNTTPGQWKRIENKTLDRAFHNRIRAGLGCSNFEADAILDVLHEVYAGFFGSGDSIAPGQTILSVVSVEASPATPLAEAPLVNVKLTLDAPGDIDVRRASGVPGLRRHRLVRVCTEALQQGGILTLEDLALRLFNCGKRTLVSDLAAIRADGADVPLRSTVKDMGRTLSHRRLIVTAWLAGKEYSEIARDTRHSVSSVRNYVSKFKRIACLKGEIDDLETIAFAAGVSQPLASQYLDLLENSPMADHRRVELDGGQPVKKKTAPTQRRSR